VRVPGIYRGVHFHLYTGFAIFSALYVPLYHDYSITGGPCPPRPRAVEHFGLGIVGGCHPRRTSAPQPSGFFALTSGTTFGSAGSRQPARRRTQFRGFLTNFGSSPTSRPGSSRWGSQRRRSSSGTTKNRRENRRGTSAPGAESRSMVAGWGNHHR
jgi:hypothetical protein